MRFGKMAAIITRVALQIDAFACFISRSAELTYLRSGAQQGLPCFQFEFSLQGLVWS